MDRKLSDYLPYVIRGYDIYRDLSDAEQPEFDLAWDNADEILDNQFLFTAGELGLSRWEKILGITPKGTETLLERRTRILARCNEELPYTLRRLRNILATLCGEGNSWAEIEENTYLLKVGIGSSAVRNFADVVSLLERITPVNLVYSIRLDLKTDPMDINIGHWMHTGDYITLGKVALSA